MKKKMTTFIVGTLGGYNITVEHHTEEQAYCLNSIMPSL